MTATERVHRARTARQVLADTRTLIGPPLRAAVDAQPDPLRQVAGYHFGWVDERGQATETGGGKMIRPALALLAADAVGGQRPDAVPAGVAVELVHNFSLLHDDVMDGDRIRHHRPTAWTVFGVPMAVLTGDMLWSLALRVLVESGAANFGDGTRTLSAAVHALIDGQGADLDFERRPRVSLAECVDMAAGKTGALLGGACALGALAGGATAEQVACLREFGERLGMAFQFVDDLLGIWGEPAKTGKPVGSDLVNRKKSLPVVFAMASRTDAGDELAALYRSDRSLSGDEVAHAADAVERAGGRQWARDEAARHLNEALSCLHAAEPAPAAAEELTALAGLIADRDR